MKRGHTEEFRAQRLADGTTEVAAPAEEWRAVPGFEGRYEVSDQGRVRSLWMAPGGHGRWRDTPRDLALYCSTRRTDRTVKVALKLDGVPSVHIVARLVLEAFVGPPPSPLHRATPKDGNPRNTMLTNLAWAPTVGHGDGPPGRGARGEHNPNAKLTQKDADAIRAAGKAPRWALAADFGVGVTTITDVRSGRRW